MTMGYFFNEDVLSALQNVVRTINRHNPTNEFEAARNYHIEQIFSSMGQHKAEWNEKTAITIESAGANFLAELQSVSRRTNGDGLNRIYVLSFRFLTEFYLSTKGELNAELSAARAFGIDKKNEFDSDAAAHLEWANANLSTVIFKSIIGSEHINNLKNLSNTYAMADQRRAEWKKELEEHEEKVSALKSSLEQYEKAFNFVGLYEGFDELANSKNKQKTAVRRWLAVMGVLIFVPLVFELVFIWININEIEVRKTALLFTVIPTLSITALLIYYFRVFLHNFNALNSQILQLDLRKTLCRFIQKYAEYAKDLKAKNNESLLRFEHIVFSPLTTNDEKLPTTFDGLEQLSNLLKNFKQ